MPPASMLPAVPGKVQVLRELLLHQAAALKETLPKHLNPERLTRIVCGAAARDPKILECTTASIFTAVFQGAQLGLEPGSAIGSAYLVPFKNSVKVGNEWKTVNEVTLIVGYRGLIDLARRSGDIKSIEARVVYERDKFRLEFGLNPIIEHIPCLEGQPGKMVAVYAVARFKDEQGYQFEFMTRAQVEEIRGRAKAKSEKSPWSTDFDEMARKTVVKRLCKYLPLSIETQEVIERDNMAEYGGSEDTPFGLDAEAEVPATATSNAKGRLRKAASPPPVEEEEEPVAPPPDGSLLPRTHQQIQGELTRLDVSMAEWDDYCSAVLCEDITGAGLRSITEEQGQTLLARLQAQAE